MEELPAEWLWALCLYVHVSESGVRKEGLSQGEHIRNSRDTINVLGLWGKVLVAQGTAGVASVRRHQCLSMSGTANPPQDTAEPVSDTGGSSVIAYLRWVKTLCNSCERGGEKANQPFFSFVFASLTLFLIGNKLN